MAKGPGQYARDQDIGKATTPATTVAVTNLEEVTVAVDAAREATEHTLPELKKIRRGTELTVGQDIGEVT